MGKPRNRHPDKGPGKGSSKSSERSTSVDSTHRSRSPHSEGKDKPHSHDRTRHGSGFSLHSQDSEVEDSSHEVDMVDDQPAGDHVSRSGPNDGVQNAHNGVQNQSYVEFDKNLMVYITCPTINLAHINLVDLNRLIGALDGNFKDCRVTRNAKLRLVCETRGQHAKLLRTTKIGNKKITVESAVSRAPTNFCLIFGVSTDITAVEIKDLLDVTPDLI